MDIQSLTAGEISRLEKLIGRSMTTFTDEDKPQADVLAGFAYLIKHREDKSFTFEQALALTLTELNEIISPDSEEEQGE